VELAREIFGSLTGKRVLLVGAGKMAESAARHLRRAGVSEILVTNRTRARAEAIAEEFQGRTLEYDRFFSGLQDVDIVIASSAAPHYILTREQMREVIGRRRNRPMFLIDIAVPRNIDPAVNDVEGVFLKDIDDLEGVVNANIKERAKQAEQAEAIVLDEVERMMSRLKIEEVTPTIVSLQEQLENIRAAEVTRALRRMPTLSPEQQQLVTAQIEAMTKSIVNKIAHGPISAIRRNAGQPDGEHIIDAVRKVFHLLD
jgi:glutamyl-tRNA reductase